MDVEAHSGYVVAREIEHVINALPGPYFLRTEFLGRLDRYYKKPLGFILLACVGPRLGP